MGAWSVNMEKELKKWGRVEIHGGVESGRDNDYTVTMVIVPLHVRSPFQFTRPSPITSYLIPEEGITSIL